jgi:hypothetical protein
MRTLAVRCVGTVVERWASVISKKLSIRPDYNTIEIRDAELFNDKNAANAAATRAGTEIAAASSEVVYIHSAQRTLPVQLTVKAYSHPRAVIDKSPWDGVLQFEIYFPSGVIRFGDMFHRADSIDLPGGAGLYAVAVHYAGREAADRALQKIYSLPDSEWDRQIEREANIERYLVILAPSGHVGV